MTNCSECGKKIGNREVMYAGAHDGKLYYMHPTCYRKWLGVQAAKEKDEEKEKEQ